MSLILQGSTSGSVTLQEPAVAGTTVLDLPATSGTVALTSQISAGKVLQVVNTTKTNTFTTTSSSYTDLTDLSVNITPTSASNQILVITSLSYGGDGNSYGWARLVRNGTAIALGDADGATRIRCTFPLTMEATASTNAKLVCGGMTILDSPATTSAVTYKVQVMSGYNSLTLSINRSYSNDNATYSGLGVSTITVMEIAA